MVCMPREERPEIQNAPLNRPPRLRQNVNLPCGLETSSPIRIDGGDGVVIDVVTLLWHIGQHIAAKFIMI